MQRSFIITVKYEVIPSPNYAYRFAIYYGGPSYGNLYADNLNEGHARRIVACVNACEGLSTEQLEWFLLDSFKECAQAGVASVVRELELFLTLLEDIYNAHRTDNSAYMGEAVLCESFARRARDLIAQCKEILTRGRK